MNAQYRKFILRLLRLGEYHRRGGSKKELKDEMDIVRCYPGHGLPVVLMNCSTCGYMHETYT